MQTVKTRHAASRYHPLSIGAHWLTLALLIAVYALIELREFFPKGSDPREAMKNWHFMLGLAVLALTCVRLPLRALFRVSPIDPAPPPWQMRAAAALHLALYAFLIVMPLLGWLVLSAKDKPVPLFGLYLPALIAPDKALAKNFEELHEVIGTLGYYLIGLHALAALFHHYFMRDDTLRRMLPRRGATLR